MVVLVSVVVLYGECDARQKLPSWLLLLLLLLLLLVMMISRSLLALRRKPQPRIVHPVHTQ